MATERTVGSYWDKQNFSDEDYNTYSNLVNAANSGEISWKDANTAANQLRSKYGYNGGSNGHEYNVNETGGTQSGATGSAPSYLTAANNASSIASNALSSYANATPYTYSRQTDYDTVLNNILNPTAFSYDYKTDPQYQSYKKEYTREGQRATADTLGQVAAMTGGQVSSNAVNAATQAGDYYSAQMADKIPELYQAAYNMYQDNLQNQYNQLSALNTDRSNEYGQYTDNLSRLSNAVSLGNSTASNDYNIYADIDDTNYNRATAEDETAYERAQDEDEKTLAAAKIMADAGDYSRLAEYYGLTEDEVKKLYAAAAGTGSGTGTKTLSLDELKSDIKAQVSSGTGTYTDTLKDIDSIAATYNLTKSDVNELKGAAAEAQNSTYGVSSIGGNPHKDDTEETGSNSTMTYDEAIKYVQSNTNMTDANKKKAIEKINSIYGKG